jgi:hypothetical protein
MEIIRRLAERIERDSGDCPSYIVTPESGGIDDGGQYGKPDTGGLPPWVLDEERTLKARRKEH